MGDKALNDLLFSMLQCDPEKRPTALECMKHPFFLGEATPTYEPPLDFTIEKHYIT